MNVPEMLGKAWSRRDHIRETFESWRLTFWFGQSFPQRQMGSQGGEACLGCLVGSLDDGVPQVVIRPCGRKRLSALLKVCAPAACGPSRAEGGLGWPYLKTCPSWTLQLPWHQPASREWGLGLPLCDILGTSLQEKWRREERRTNHQVTWRATLVF